MEKYLNILMKYVKDNKLLMIATMIIIIILLYSKSNSNSKLNTDKIIYTPRGYKIIDYYNNVISNSLRKNYKLKDKSIAICLFGIHYQDNYRHHRLGNININFQKYTNNIKNLFKDFKKNDYYIVTNNSPIQNKLYDNYNPKEILYTSKKRDSKILMILEYLKDSRNIYDFIAISRIDIFYMIDLYDIDMEKINIISILEGPDLICDNFYLIPYKYLDTMINIFRNIKKYSTHNLIPSHGLKNIFREKMGINYLKNENTDVWNLTSYYIHI